MSVCRKSRRWGLLFAGVVACTTVACGDKDEKKDESAEKKDDDGEKKSDGEKDDDAKAAGPVSAASHLPGDCEVVVNADIAKILGAKNMAEVRTSLKGAIDKQTEKDKGDDKSFGAFLTNTKLDPTKDITSVALCLSKVLDGPDPDVSFAFAGDFKSDEIIAGLEKASDKVKKEKVGDLDALVMGGDEMRIAAAPDGVIVGAKSSDVLTTISKASKAYEAYKLPEKPLAVVFAADFVKKGLKSDPNNPFAAYADKAKQAYVGMDPETGAVRMSITMTDEKAAIELGGLIKQVLPKMAEGTNPADPMADMMATIKEAEVNNEGPKLNVTFTIPADMLKGMVSKMSAGL